jgi:hypothetical protein
MTEKKKGAVQDGKLMSVSPSQIQRWLECPRQWYFDKVERRGNVATASQEQGTAMHTQMEEYFELGKVPEHPSCQAALELDIIPRGTTLEMGRVAIEQPRDFNTKLVMAGTQVMARVDFQFKPIAGDTFLVLDWKSCKNYQYVKSPDELSRNPQGIIYLHYGFSQFEGTKTGRFGHVYLKTTSTYGAKASITDRLSKQQVREGYEELENVVREMQVAAGASDQQEVRYNQQACGKFGGCPYRAVCNAGGQKHYFDMDEFMGKEKPATPETQKKSLSSFLNSFKNGTLPKKTFTEKVNTNEAPAPPRTLSMRDQMMRPNRAAPFELVTDLVTDSPINPPDVRAPYDITPWSPEDKP